MTRRAPEHRGPLAAEVVDVTVPEESLPVDSCPVDPFRARARIGYARVSTMSRMRA